MRADAYNPATQSTRLISGEPEPPHGGPFVTDHAPAPVLLTLFHYLDADSLRTIAGDAPLSGGMRHVPALRALSSAVMAEQLATREFDAAVCLKESDPQNTRAFENPRLVRAYEQVVLQRNGLHPRVESALVNGLSFLTKAAAIGVTAKAVNDAPQTPTSEWIVLSGLIPLAIAANLAARRHHRLAVEGEQRDMSHAVSLELDRLGSQVSHAQEAVHVALRQFDIAGAQESSITIHVTDEDPLLTPQS
ncbi:hypothetical protein [Caenimonas sp. SL110]|uniref:hypothetical protein n=1 Tax=Caenimonas sp. SL110 TaxID=1450524 RepID=UPI000652F88A|nr:hypothetical protein [Caenimonas sp. SL110]